jgi:hypothetical protein
MKISDNLVALALIGAFGAALTIFPIPGPNGQVVAALAGGLIGFLKTARDPQNPQ